MFTSKRNENGKIVAHKQDTSNESLHQRLLHLESHFTLLTHVRETCASLKLHFKGVEERWQATLDKFEEKELEFQKTATKTLKELRQVHTEIALGKNELAEKYSIFEEAKMKFEEVMHKAQGVVCDLRQMTENKIEGCTGSLLLVPERGRSRENIPRDVSQKMVRSVSRRSLREAEERAQQSRVEKAQFEAEIRATAVFQRISAAQRHASASRERFPGCHTTPSQHDTHTRTTSVLFGDGD